MMRPFQNILLVTHSPRLTMRIQQALQGISSHFAKASQLLLHKAESGQEGQILLQHILPDCVLFDPHLPDTNEDSWLSSLLAQGLHRSFPLMYLSTHPPAVGKDFCLESLDPFSLTSTEFLERLHQLANRWQQEISSRSSSTAIPTFAKSPSATSSAPSPQRDKENPANTPNQQDPSEESPLPSQPNLPASPSSCPTLAPLTFETPAPPLPQAPFLLRTTTAQEKNPWETHTLAERWFSAMRHSHSGLWYWSPHSTQPQPWHEALPLAQPLEALLPRFHINDAKRLQEALQEYYQEPEQMDTFSFTIRTRPETFKPTQHTPEAHWHWLLCRGSRQSFPWLPYHEVWGFFMDITLLKEEEARLAYLAFHDPLTGLANRALFTERLQQAVERLRRYKRPPITLLFLDFDRFKDINDHHGHSIGDQLLQQFARRLSRCIRSVDTVARLGGDEFVLLLDAAPTLDDARLVADRIQLAMKEPFTIEHLSIPLTISIGMYWSESAPESAEHILQRADEAMYSAKRKGGDTLMILSESAKKSA